MKNKRVIIQTAVLIFAVIFIFLGVIRDEHRIVLSKAVRICLSCIGIG